MARKKNKNNQKNQKKQGFDKASQMAKTGTQNKVKPEDLNVSFGSSGTSLINGLLNEEYNNTLSGTHGAEIFERMRRSDAQVFATLLACEMPIRSTKWYVEPAENEDGEIDDDAQEVASFVERAIFEKMENTFDNFLLEVLTMLAFGYSVFEKVYTSDGEFVWLKKLGSRKQSTILRWETQKGGPGITQMLPGGKEDEPNEGQNQVSIPAEKLIIFSNRREGDNYEGVSILRSAYKHWYYKDTLYKFDAVRHERQSVGIPVIYTPSNLGDEDRAKAERLVENVRASEQAGIVMPGPKDEGWLFEFADTKSWENSDLYESIKHHNREISKNILAQFLELGDTGSGSRSLSEDQSSLFLLTLEAVAKNIADTVNRYLIPELVDLNFDVERYPKISFKSLGKVDFEGVSNSLKNLADGGVLRPDDELEDHIRDMMNLPGRSKDNTRDKDIGKKQDNKDTGNGNGKNNPKDNSGDDMKKDNNFAEENNETESCEHETPDGFSLDEKYMELSSLYNNDVILDVQRQAHTQEAYEAIKKKGLKLNEYESQSPRPLTFAERKVNFSNLKKSMQEFEEKVLQDFDDISGKTKEDLLKQVKKAVENNDIAAVGKIKAKYAGELASSLTDVQKEMFEVGKKSAATEMDVKVPKTSGEVRGAMRIQNDALVSKIQSDIESSTKTGVSEMVAKQGGDITKVSATAAVGAVSEVIDKKIQSARANIATLAVTGSTNLGRTTIYERYPEKIYWMQYSAIIDQRTTQTCLSLDGRVVKPGSSEFYDYMPPRHYNCRSIWVEILQEETFKPEYNNVPSSVPKNATIDGHKDMKTPDVLKDSQAVDQIRQEIQTRRKKLEQYEKAGTFPNRQELHKDRIKKLEKSLEKKFTEGLHEYAKNKLREEGIEFKS